MTEHLNCTFYGTRSNEHGCLLHFFFWLNIISNVSEFSCILNHDYGWELMTLVMFEEVFSISSNDVHEQCKRNTTKRRRWMKWNDPSEFFYVSTKRARLRESPGLYECWRAPDYVRMSIMVFEVVQYIGTIMYYNVKRILNR